jgi:sugar lactone lactonase YvrE
VIAGSFGPFDPPVEGPSGPTGFSGDGGPAVKAEFSYLVGMAIDASGNIYLADNGNNRIRRISPNGVVQTVAGSGDAARFGGDDGPATKALLGGPDDVKVDGDGNLFIADSGNNRVRKVDAKGVITTFAGTGEAANSGDGG